MSGSQTPPNSTNCKVVNPTTSNLFIPVGGLTISDGSLRISTRWLVGHTVTINNIEYDVSFSMYRTTGTWQSSITYAGVDPSKLHEPQDDIDLIQIELLISADRQKPRIRGLYYVATDIVTNETMETVQSQHKPYDYQHGWPPKNQVWSVVSGDHDNAILTTLDHKELDRIIRKAMALAL